MFLSSLQNERWISLLSGWLNFADMVTFISIAVNPTSINGIFLNEVVQSSSFVVRNYIDYDKAWLPLIIEWMNTEEIKYNHHSQYHTRELKRPEEYVCASITKVLLEWPSLAKNKQVKASELVEYLMSFSSLTSVCLKKYYFLNHPIIPDAFMRLNELQLLDCHYEKLSKLIKTLSVHCQELTNIAVTILDGQEGDETDKKLIDYLPLLMNNKKLKRICLHNVESWKSEFNVETNDTVTNRILDHVLGSFHFGHMQSVEVCSFIDTEKHNHIDMSIIVKAISLHYPVIIYLVVHLKDRTEDQLLCEVKYECDSATDEKHLTLWRRDAKRIQSSEEEDEENSAFIMLFFNCRNFVSLSFHNVSISGRVASGIARCNNEHLAHFDFYHKNDCEKDMRRGIPPDCKRIFGCIFNNCRKLWTNSGHMIVNGIRYRKDTHYTPPKPYGYRSCP